MQHPDEGTIHAWIDGELSQDEAAALEAHLAECTECSASVAEARGLVAASSRIVSALDIVPGGVVPAVPARRRPWYASTQLRAAAAIAIVGSASMLVMRDRTDATMDSVLAVTAPAEVPAPAPVESPVSAEADKAMVQRETPAASSATPSDIAQDLRKEKAEAAPRQRLERQPEARSPASPPPPAAVQPAPSTRVAADEASAAKTGNVLSDSSKRGFSAPMHDAVVITGVAVAPLPLKEVRSDSTAGTRRTFYEVSPGVEVTLTDAPPVRSAPQMRRSVAREAVSAAATAPGAALKAESINSISWRDKRGHTMTLSGPVSKEQLESIRRQLPEDKR